MVQYDVIYLQDGSDPKLYAEIEVTWCSDRVNDDDTKYVKADKLAECQDAREDTYSTFDDTMNDIWGSIYPEEPKSWEYPGMVTRHVRAVIKELSESKQQNELYKRALMQCHADMGSRLPWDKWLEWTLKGVEKVIGE